MLFIIVNNSHTYSLYIESFNRLLGSIKFKYSGKYREFSVLSLWDFLVREFLVFIFVTELLLTSLVIYLCRKIIPKRYLAYLHEAPMYRMNILRPTARCLAISFVTPYLTPVSSQSSINWVGGCMWSHSVILTHAFILRLVLAYFVEEYEWNNRRYGFAVYFLQVHIQYECCEQRSDEYDKYYRQVE